MEYNKIVSDIKSNEIEFLKEFEKCLFTDKITIIIKFIEKNLEYINNVKLNFTDDEYATLTDAVTVLPSKLFITFTYECLNDDAKRKLIFIEKEFVSEYGDTMWEEYNYILLNYSSWPLTNKAKFLWATNVLEFGGVYTKPISEKKEGCYIATMAYRDYNHPQVLFLRQYRDNVLNKSEFGKWFIKTYYYYSPILVGRLKNKKTLNYIIRKILNQIIKLIK